MAEREELHPLLMGYLDGELDAAERARVEEALESDPALRRDLEEMRRLVEATGDLGVDTKSDVELESFWGGVYNRLERRTAWVLLTLGALGLAAAALYLFFTAPGSHWAVKLPAACALLGALILLWSVWRERRKVLPHDRYSREVRR
jgi:anti-sigma factor RsiW